MMKQSIPKDHNHTYFTKLYYKNIAPINKTDCNFLKIIKSNLQKKRTEPENKSMCLKPTRWTTEEHSGL